MTRLVRDAMHRGVISCRVDTPLEEIAQRLMEYQINALFVLDQSGKACGVVSQTDLVRAYVQGGWSDLVAEDIMTPDVVTVVPDIPVTAAAQLMLDKDIHRLLIVQGGLIPDRPVGVLSMSDIVREMAREGEL
jgi:CBS domain-containing protein